MLYVIHILIYILILILGFIWCVFLCAVVLDVLHDLRVRFTRTKGKAGRGSPLPTRRGSELTADRENSVQLIRLDGDP